MEKNKNVKII